MYVCVHTQNMHTVYTQVAVSYTYVRRYVVATMYYVRFVKYGQAVHYVP